MRKAKKNKWAGHVKNKYYEVFLILRISNKERRRNTMEHKL